MQKNFKIKVIAIILAILTVTAVIPFAAMETLAAAWNGTVASSFESGTGYENDPYIIKTAEQLALLAKNVNEGEEYEVKFFRLEADIVLNTSTSKRNWPGIGKWYVGSDGYHEFVSFKGIFDGNGKTISGLYCSASGENGASLFGSLGGATIKNLKITGANIKSESRAGIIASYASHGTIENCTVDGTVEGVGKVGGLVGFSAYNTYSNCTSSASVKGESCVGGIVGDNWDNEFYNCKNSGNVTGNEYVGGITGDFFEGKIENCVNSGKIKTPTNGEYMICGGIAGRCAAVKIKNCENTGEVIGINTIGGIVGVAESIGMEGTDERDPTVISNCKNTGKIGKSESSSDYHIPAFIGGIIGLLYTSELKDCNNTGSVLGSQNVGGIAGRAVDVMGNIENCFNSGAVTGKDWVAGIVAEVADEGGCIVAESYPQINYCANIGDIKGECYVGGISGAYYNALGNGKINECYNRGDIEGISYVGGIAGEVSAETSEFVVSYCANDGIITLNSNESYCFGGGIIGEAENTKIVQCVNNGTSSYGSNNFFGGIVGHSHNGDVKLFDCKYLNTSANLGYAAENHEALTTDEATPLSASELKNKSNFANYDFDNIFRMGTIGVVPKNVLTFLLGDVNGDGVVDKKDYAALKRYCFGTVNLSEESLLAADVNKDGEVDKKDYAFLKRYCFGTVAL